MIPKYSLMGPFRGHMSIKSSLFSPGSSCKLSSQYIIQDHMAMHYRKLLSAKAAVDSSAPKSLNTSIKYRDQQKKEQLIKAVEKIKKEMGEALSATPCHSRCISTENHKGLLPRGRMPSLGTSKLSLPKYLKQMHLSNDCPIQKAEKMTQSTAQWCLPQAPNNGGINVLRSVLPLTHSRLPLPGYRKTKKFLIPQNKSLGGDLLDTHARCFTETKQPFTPKVLKTARKSFLSKYRYYNHPTGKKNLSFNPPSEKRPTKIFRSLEDECLRSPVDYHILHPVKKHCQNLVSVQRLLRANITICCSEEARAFDDVFQWHIRNRSCDLDEVYKNTYIVRNMLSPAAE
ncbi:hypothetical protein JRQ81_004789 [Phrynocephalus forsythii]|uniref:Uncharacterized protein n=1 Tax=Phrynocephalus forsythii TaxID=171643 RepID=A0A9Q1B6G4_9SAUR|nr:hypothetical protein JRQ81_004789 [Phrynocephalus forsythii]